MLLEMPGKQSSEIHHITFVRVLHGLESHQVEEHLDIARMDLFSTLIRAR